MVRFSCAHVPNRGGTLRNLACCPCDPPSDTLKEKCRCLTCQSTRTHNSRRRLRRSCWWSGHFYVRPHMQIAYALLAVVLGVPSGLLGLFFLGSVGLGVSGSPMLVGWIAWFAGVAVAAVGMFFAVRKC